MPGFPGVSILSKTEDKDVGTLTKTNEENQQETVKRRGRPKKIDTTDEQVGQDHPREMLSTGDALIEEPIIEAVPGPEFNRKMEALAFLEEPVEILVHESTDKNSHPVVQTYCNGRAQFFVRGVPATVKRKFVGALARAKKTSYTQATYEDAEGNQAIKNIPHTALRYPFSVINDANRNGSAWLQKTLAEA